MRIPPYYRYPSWQRFFAGMAIGGAISWCIFLYIFGVWQEKHTALIKEQTEDILDLENEKKIWQEEYKEINKRTIEQLTIQKINVKLTNGEKYDLDLLSVSEIEDAIKDDISMMIAKDLDTVYKSKELIKKIIHNKTVKIQEKRYNLQVKEMVFYSTLTIHIELEFEK
ncbi:sporulation membrane protein YtrI [Neobacillus sp. K501]